MERSLDHKILRGTEGESAVTRVIVDNGLSVNLLPRGGRSKHITEPCGRIGSIFSWYNQKPPARLAPYIL